MTWRHRYFFFLSYQKKSCDWWDKHSCERSSIRIYNLIYLNTYLNPFKKIPCQFSLYVQLTKSWVTLNCRTWFCCTAFPDNNQISIFLLRNTSEIFLTLMRCEMQTQHLHELCWHLLYFTETMMMMPGIRQHSTCILGLSFKYFSCNAVNISHPPQIVSVTFVSVSSSL